ncbi:MAG: translation initiation factor IF-3 [Parcubacteria group bacterium]|nr:translation initiation factor IF-3 [Parcubacteria group bacterium]
MPRILKTDKAAWNILYFVLNLIALITFRRPRSNYQIRTPQVLVIGEDGQKLGVLNTPEAVKMAQDKGLSLVEIAPQENPPIAKIMDFGKWLYEKEKAEKKKIKGAKTEFKIVRVGLMTGNHDLEIKAKKIDEFLKKNDKIQIELQLRGRQIVMKDLGRQKIKKFMEFIKEPFEPESDIKSQGRSLGIIIKKK